MSIICRPFSFFEGFKEINQVATVVSDLDEAVKKVSNTLALGSWEVTTFGPPNHFDTQVRGNPVFYSHKNATACMGPVQFEIIAPLEGPSIYKEFLKEGKDGMLHHVARFYNSWDDVNREIRRFEKQGIKVIQTGKFGTKEKHEQYFYFDTAPKMGFIYEITYIPADNPRRPPEQIIP